MRATQRKGKPTDVTAESLLGIQAFAGLELEARQRIASLSRGYRYPANALILSHRDTSADVYFIVAGEVRVTFYSVSGREVTFRNMSAGQLFGELSAIDGEPRSATIIALTDTFIASFSPAVFWEVIEQYPPVAAAVMKGLVRLVRRLSDRVIEFSTLAVKNRIHAELLRLAQDHMVSANCAEISPAPTQTDIATRVSTHREAVNRELSELSRLGLVERSPSVLRIRDVAQLSRLVKEVDD